MHMFREQITQLDEAPRERKYSLRLDSTVSILPVENGPTPKAKAS